MSVCLSPASVFLGSSVVKNLSADAGDVGLIPGLERSPGEEMASHSCILAWEMLWTEEPGGLQSTRSQRVGHDLETERVSCITPSAVA